MTPNQAAHEPPVEAEPPKRLLVVDDDAELCGLLAEFLEREGFAVDLVHDGQHGLDAALAGHHQAIVLDVMLPGMGGFEVLRRIRERKRTPVLMLTARGDHVDRIIGLELGADDYIPKPFDPRELAARIRAVLRRASPPPAEQTERIVVGEIVVEPGSRAAHCAGRALDLTAAEFDLLSALANSAGSIVSREDLSQTALGRAFDPRDRSVDVHISNLRRKLGSAGAPAELIKTVRGAGYLLARALPDGGD